MKVKELLSKACSVCGSTRFGVVKEVTMELASGATKGWAVNARPEFDVVVCVGCGWTQFFMRPGKEHILESCRHEVVELASKTPYR